MSSLNDTFIVTGTNTIEQSSKVPLPSRDLDNPVKAQLVKKPSIIYEIRASFMALCFMLY